jgi:hypothetical protein
MNEPRAHSHLNSPTLNRLVLDHLIHQIVNGDHTLADQLGLDTQIRAQLMDLRSIEINRLAELRGCVCISVDVPALARLLDHLLVERRQEETIKELVRKDAPQSMLRSLYQLTSREVTALRYSLGLPGSPGRTRQPSEEEEHRAWEIFQRMGLALDDMSPGDWIRFQEQAGIPLRVLWTMFNQWRMPVEAAP